MAGIDPSIISQLKLPQQPTPFEQIGQLQTLEGQDISIKEHKAELAKQQKAQQDADQIGAAYKAALTPGPDGKPTFNRAILLQHTPADHLPAMIKELDAADAAALKNEETKALILKNQTDAADTQSKIDAADLEYQGALAAQVKASNYDPSVLGLAAAHATSHGHDVIDHLMKAMQSGASVQQVTDATIQASKTQRERMTAEAAQAATAANALADNARADKTLTETERHNKAMEAKPTTATVQIGAMNAPAQQFDATKPDPRDPASNKLDPATGKTPNGLYQDALQFALTGQIPAGGRSSVGQAANARNAITAKAGALVAASGVDMPTLRAEYRANAGTLAKTLPIVSRTQAAMDSANDNLQLALEKSADVGRSGSSFANRYLQWAQGNLTDAKDLSQFEVYIYTAAREYAKVTSGGAMSAAGLTDSASKEAGVLLNAAKAPESFASSVKAMQDDMRNVQSNNLKQVKAVSDTIANFLSATTGVQIGGGDAPSPSKTPTPLTSGLAGLAARKGGG